MGIDPPILMGLSPLTEGLIQEKRFYTQLSNKGGALFQVEFQIPFVRMEIKRPNLLVNSMRTIE
jgi:hypothetical protein